MSTQRQAVVYQGIFAALGNASLTINGLVKAVHASHPDIKHVILVREVSEMKHFTFWVRYHDRSSDSYSLYKGNWSEVNDQ